MGKDITKKSNTLLDSHSSVKSNFYFKDRQGINIFTKKWYPPENQKIYGVIQIAHGMGETSDYYSEFSEQISKSGFIVYINEARGHGRTAGDISNPSYEINAGYMGHDGINWMVEDLNILTDIIKNQNPNLPIFLLGHSLGSVLAQIYAYKYGNNLNGIIYSGTTGPIEKSQIRKFIEIANIEASNLGRKAPSVDAANAFFEHWNDQFQPSRTDYDWLTRDNDMLDETLNSPYAAINYKVGYYVDFFNSLINLHEESFIDKIPKRLPVLSISGSKDSFGNNGEGIIKLFQLYKKHGLEDTTYKIYENGRHEMLREINRNEVIEDIKNWLYDHIY